MGDQDGGDAEPALQCPQLDLHLLAQALVEGAERLVEQQDRRPHHQRAGQRHPLLLAAGQLRGHPPGIVGELHQLQRRGDARRLALAADMPRLEPKGDVFGDIHVREQRVVLKQHADVAAMRRDPGDRPIVEKDLAGAGLDQTGDHPQGGGLAAARGAEQRHHAAGLDRQRQPVDGAGVAEYPGQLAQAQGDGAAIVLTIRRPGCTFRGAWAGSD